MKKLLLALAATTMLTGTAFAGAHSPVKIGVILGFTGPLESITPAMGAGAELAMKEVSDSGKLLDGVKVEPVRADSTCVDAAAALNARGVAARSVSLPSWDRFAEQGRAFRDEVLPPGVPVVSVEAATTFGWERYADVSIGIDRFGASAPGELVLDKLGINVEHVVQRALDILP